MIHSYLVEMHITIIYTAWVEWRMGRPNPSVYMVLYEVNLSILTVRMVDLGVPCKKKILKAWLYAWARQSPIGRILSDTENALNPSSCDVTQRWVIDGLGGNGDVDSSRILVWYVCLYACSMCVLFLPKKGDCGRTGTLVVMLVISVERAYLRWPDIVWRGIYPYIFSYSS